MNNIKSLFSFEIWNFMAPFVNIEEIQNGLPFLACLR